MLRKPHLKKERKSHKRPFRFSFPAEYEGPEPIETQVRTLARIFNLNPNPALKFAKELPALPTGATGWAAVPNRRKIAKQSKGATRILEGAVGNLGLEGWFNDDFAWCDDDETLAKSQLVLLNLFGRKFLEWCRKEHAWEEYLESAEPEEVFNSFKRQQRGNIMLIPMKCNFCRTSNDSRFPRFFAVSCGKEVPIGMVAFNCILATHGKKLKIEYARPCKR